MKNFKENLSYFAQAEQTSKIKAGLWAEFSISTAALVKIKYCFLPSQTQEVEVGYHVPVMQRAETMGEGIIQMTMQSLKVISFAEIEEAFSGAMSLYYL